MFWYMHDLVHTMFWYMRDWVHFQQNKNNNQDGIVEHKHSTKVQYWVLVVIWGIMDEHLELDKVQVCTKNPIHKCIIYSR